MQYQAAYNRMTPKSGPTGPGYAPRIAEYERMKGRVSQEELTRWKYQQYMKDYCAVIKGVDENVGRLLDYLEEIGELDNTIIVYTSDGGFFLGEHGGSTSVSCTRSASARRCWCATRKPLRRASAPGGP